MTVTQRRVRAADPSRPEDRVGEYTAGADASRPLTAAVTEPGVKYTCDICGVDITHTVRIKCAAKECEEVDLCPNCFSEGKEVQRHRAWHPYKVVEQHSYPIFTSDWGADEELLLISGCILHGLGNWIEIADHVGTRTKEECESHYLEVYLGVGDGPETKKESEMPHDDDEDLKYSVFMPPMDRKFDIDPDEFQARKKARIEELRKPLPLPSGNAAAPLVSAPTNHEVGGFMPGRLEFEHEIDNDAELAVKDFEFGLVFKYGGDEQPQAKVTRPVEEDDDEEGEDEEEDVKPKIEDDADSKADQDGESSTSGSTKRKRSEKATEPALEVEDEEELEVKLALLDIYFSKLDKREAAKDFIFDRALTEHKKILGNERKRPKEERELVGRYKVFAKLQTAQDFEALIEGLIFEQQLRRRIGELQEYRRMGITTGAEAEHYETVKAARAGYRPVLSREQTEVIRTGARVNAGQHRFLHGTPPPGADSRGASRDPPVQRALGHGGRKPPAPLNLANAASLDLLTNEEQVLCSQLRVLPKPYLLIKDTYIRENERRKGLLKRRDARKMMKIDVNKSGRIFDFLVSTGVLKLMYDPTMKGMGPGKEGHHVGGPIDVHTGRPLNPMSAPVLINGTA